MDKKLRDTINRAGGAIKRSGFRNVYEKAKDERPDPPPPPTEGALCTYHHDDLDEQNVPFPCPEHQPMIWCSACRRSALAAPAFHMAWFSVNEIRVYEEDHPQETQVLRELRMDP